MMKLPIRVSRRMLTARLLLTTALVGMSPVMGMLQPARGDDLRFNNAGTNPPAATSGDWNADDPLWRDVFGFQTTITSDDRGIFERPQDGAATITIIGTVLPGELRAVDNGFRLTGGQIGQADGSTVLSASNSVTFSIGSALGGDIEIDGWGTVFYDGAAEEMQSITVRNNGNLETGATAVTAGDMQVNGDAVLAGRHNGDVEINGSGVLESGGVIAGNLTTNGDFTVSGEIIQADTDDAVTNFAGDDEALTLNGAQINTDLENTSDGNLVVAGANSIDGNVLNSGEIVAAADAPGSLVIAAGKTFTNEGRITEEGDLTIQADELNLLDDSEVDSAAVKLVGNIDNSGDLTYSTASQLSGSLTNSQNGEVVIRAELAGNDEQISNKGWFLVDEAGEVKSANLTNEEGGEFELRGQFSGVIINEAGGTVTFDDGVLTGNLVNEGEFSGDGEITGQFTNNTTFELRDNLSVGSAENNGTFTFDSDRRLNLTDGNLVNNGELTITTGVDSSSDGLVINNSGATLNLDRADMTAGVLNQQGGTVNLSADSRVSADFENRGILKNTRLGAVWLNLEDNDFTNSGTIGVGNHIYVSAANALLGQNSDLRTSAITLGATIVNSGRFVVDSVYSLRDDFTNNATGTLVVSGRLDGEEHSIENSGTIDVIDFGRIEDVVQIANSNRISVAENATVQVNELLNSAGGVLDLAGELQGDLSNQTGATTNLNGGNVTGDLVNAGELTGSGSVEGKLTNSVALSVFGNIAAGSVDNSGAVTVHTPGVLTLTDGVFDNTGTLGVRGRIEQSDDADNALIRNRADAALNLVGATIATDVENEVGGTVDVRVSSRLDGDFVNSGSLTRTVSSSATEAADLDMSGNSFTNEGTITNTSGLGFRIIADELFLQGASIDNAVVTLVGNIFNSSELLFSQASTLAGDLVTQEGGRTVIGAATDVDGHSLRNEGITTIHNISSVTGADQVVNDGQFRIRTGSSLTANSFTNLEDANLLLAGQLNGDLLARSGSMTTLESARIAGDVQSSGLIAGTGEVTGNFSNAGQLDVNGELTVGRLQNYATTTISADSALTSSGSVVNRGQFELSGALAITNAAASFVNREGGVLSFNGGSLKANAVNELGGLLQIRADTTIDGTLSNDGEISAPVNQQVTLSLLNDKTFINNGKIDAQTYLTIRASQIVLEKDSDVNGSRVRLIGDVYNSGDLDFPEDAVLENNILNTPDGLMRVWANVDGQGNSVLNEGRMEIGHDSDSSGNLFNVSELRNSKEIDIADGTSLEAVQINNNAGGEIVVAGDMTGAVANAADATIALRGGKITGDVANTGLLEGRGTVTGTVQNNTGAVRVDGTMNVGTMANRNILQVTDSGRLVSGNEVRNAGQATVEGTVAADFTNLSSGTLRLQNGLITGALSNIGELEASGSLGAGFVNDGTLTTIGNLTVQDITNNDEANVGAGHTLIARSGFDNNGELDLRGNLTGQLRNSAEGVAQLAAGSAINGSVQNAGELRGQTTINGALSNSGSATLGGRTGAITNTGNLRASGALTADSLDNRSSTVIADGQSLTARDGVKNTGNILVQGQLATNGDAKVENLADGKLSLDGALVAADVVNEAGALLDIQSSSTIAGDLVNRGDLKLTGNEATRLSVRDTFTNSGVVGVDSKDGFLTIEAGDIDLLAGSEVDNSRVALIGAVSNEGDLVYRRDSALTGDLRNTTNGNIRVLADLDADGFNVMNSGNFVVGAAGDPGRLHGVEALDNSGQFTINSGSSVEAGATLNRDGGVMRIGGTLTSTLENRSGSTVRMSGGRIVGDVTNDGEFGGSGRISGALTNDGSVVLTADEQLAVSGLVTNNAQMNVAGTLTGSVLNNDSLSGSGTISRRVDNRGDLVWSGTIGGNLVNYGDAQIRNQVGGQLVNHGKVTLSGDLTAGGTVFNMAAGDDGNASEMTVADGQTLTASRGVVNQTGAQLTNGGRIVGDLTNRGIYNQNGVLRGNLLTTGASDLSGSVTGDVDFAGGTLNIRENLAIGGDLILRRDFDLASGREITATNTIVAEDAVFDLAGKVSGTLQNAGDLYVTGNTANVDGTLHNVGTVDLSRDRGSSDVLRVGGLSGEGIYKLDVNLRDMTSDRIDVNGGAATGNYLLDLNYIGAGGIPEIGQSLTLIDVDEAQGEANDYTFSINDLPTGTERIVYAVHRAAENGDLQFSTGLNPAIGGLIGNVTLTQTLIGSIVNRPTSPFVTGLAYEDAANPCGVGAWGRATGGTATTTGASDNGINSLESTISTNYYGMQVGSDLACFDNRYNGWNMAFGVLGGVNQGDTTQPVYVNDPLNPDVLTSIVGSVNKTDFTQAYGGVYATATRDRLQADLQIRAERTDFTIENVPVGNSKGLGLGKQDFSSTGHTVSGSVGYAMDIPNMEGWSVVPTTGFAWSRIKTDSIKFDPLEEGVEEYLHFEDSNRTIGFVGATVARTYVQPSRNTALYAFATGTVYHDFADPTVSVYERVGDDSIKPQRLESENLGTYGEISFGANYIKVLGEGARARQFSTSARVDARFGDGLDSIGVTGQVRWQF